MVALVLVTGPPGTGKSTLAADAADVLGCAVLAWDWAMAALRGFPTVQAAVEDLDFLGHRTLGWTILWNLAELQLREGRSVVLDGVARTAEVAATRELVTRCGARLILVSTWCSDPAVHRARIEGRRRDFPGWPELTWSSVERTLRTWEPPGDPDLHLDATAPLDGNRRLVRSTLEAVRDLDGGPAGG